MTKKILLALTTLAALTLSFSSCKKDDNGGGDNPKTEIKLKVEPKEVQIMVGETAQLTVTVDPADTKYTFESSNADIATVSDKGVVTGVKAGKIVVTVKAGDVTKTANVEVLDGGNIDTNTGIGDKTKDVPHFIFIPANKDDFNKENAEIFKKAMTSAGWLYSKLNENEKIKSMFFVFDSPKGDKGAKFFYNRLAYVHTSKSGNPQIELLLNLVSEDDPLAPENQASAEEEGVVALWKTLYGFDQQTGYEVVQGLNAWSGYNTTAIEGTPLNVFIYSQKLTKDDVPDQPEFIGYYQINTIVSYATANGQSAQISSLPAEGLRSLALKTPLRAIKR